MTSNPRLGNVRRGTIRRRFYKVLTAALIGLSCGPAQADVATWTGEDGNGNWSNLANWDPAAYPAIGDSAVFGNSAQMNVRADFSSYPTTAAPYDQPALHLESLTFDPAAPSYTIELYSDASTSTVYQSNLQFDGAGVVNFSGQAQTFTIDQSTPSLFNYPPGSSIVFNNAASAANASYHAEGGSTVIQNSPSGQLAARSDGGRVLFNDSASAGTGTFIADGGIGNGARFARVELHENSTAASGTFTNNGGVNGPSFGNTQTPGFGGQTTFFDNANAGAANFTNQGNAVIGGSAGFTIFTQSSSAAGGVFVNNGGTGANASGGQTGFSGNATAGNGTFTNNGGAVDGGSGGATQFSGNSTAANGNFINNSGMTPLALGGQTIFGDSSTAGFATIANHGPTGQFAYAGKTVFNDAASAGSATITNLPSSVRPTTTDFYGTSTAASATIINRSGEYPTVPGITTFHDSSSAGNGTLMNDSATPAGGAFIFEDSSTAGQATFTNGAFGGSITFYDHSTAGQANIFLRSKANTILHFRDNSSAGDSNIDIGPLTYGEFNEPNDAHFLQNATAANSTITVRGDGGRLAFTGHYDVAGNPSATAGNAVIAVLGSTRPGNDSGAPGRVLFNSYSTAGNATLIAQAATVAGAPGGSIVFFNGGRAGAATLIANGGATAVNGGRISLGSASGSAGIGDSARIVVNAGGLADFSLNAPFGSTAVGSIEGAGRFSLGASSLTVGNLNTSTTVSGNITDDGGGYHTGTGGMLTKVGTGTLTLSGANSYTGLTTVDEGTLVINGSIAGGAVVKDGGILKGTGSMGTPAVESGGIFAPGLSPGTITVGGLNLMSGATLEYELGATRDRIVVTNNGNVTLGGRLDLSILSGFTPTPGETFSLFEGAIGSITGAFSAVNTPIFNGHPLSLRYADNQVLLQVGQAATVNQVVGLATAIPGGTGNFTGFHSPTFPAIAAHPSFGGGAVAFLGAGAGGQQGIYRIVPGEPMVPGEPIKLADLNTAVPSGTGNFTDFFPQLSAHGSEAAVLATGSGGQQGIYRLIPGNPIKVADLNTAIPDGIGNFTAFPLASPVISHGNVAFLGAGSGGQQGIYRVIPGDPAIPGNPIRVADLNTAVPGGTGNFTGFMGEPPISGANVAFIASGAGGQQGVYRVLPSEPHIPGNPIKVADTATIMPGSADNFQFFESVSMDRSVVSANLAFVGGGLSGKGVFNDIGGLLAMVANFTTNIPDGDGLFRDFGSVAFDPDAAGNPITAFMGFGSAGQEGIYAQFDGGLHKVIDTGDILDSKSPVSFRLGASGLDLGRLTFGAMFEDGSEGLYDRDFTPGLAGDANGDDEVNRADLAVVVGNFGLANGAFWSDGDFDGNGRVDLLDLATLQSNLGSGVSNPSPTNIDNANLLGATIPEPSSLVLAAFGLASGLLSWRRRGNRLALTFPEPELSTQTP